VGTTRPHTVYPKSHIWLGSKVKTTNLSKQNVNAKRNFQKPDSCIKFHDCHNWTEMGETQKDREVGVVIPCGRGPLQKMTCTPPWRNKNI